MSDDVMMMMVMMMMMMMMIIGGRSGARFLVSSLALARRRCCVFGRPSPVAASSACGLSVGGACCGSVSGAGSCRPDERLLLLLGLGETGNPVSTLMDHGPCAPLIPRSVRFAREKPKSPLFPPPEGACSVSVLL